jgi:hypothetical protein
MYMNNQWTQPFVRLRRGGSTNERAQQWSRKPLIGLMVTDPPQRTPPGRWGVLASAGRGQAQCPVDELLVPQPVPQVALETGNRVKVLRRP